MELVEQAKSANDFGLRKRFPWTDYQSAPWTTIVTGADEISFVRSKLFSLLRQNSVIRRVENPYLWARYVLSHEELNANMSYIVGESYVIHATTLQNALNISDVNFDWRRVHRARFGRGVSFSTSAIYANKYASGKDSYIIAGIPIGNKTLGNYNTKIPVGCYDTTEDSRGNVIVKYYDNDFYPYYIVQ